MKIGIEKPYVIDVVDSNQKIKLRSFNGNECLNILKLIIFDEIEPSFGENENYQKIFNDFHDIFIKVKTNIQGLEKLNSLTKQY